LFAYSKNSSPKPFCPFIARKINSLSNFRMLAFFFLTNIRNLHHPTINNCNFTRLKMLLALLSADVPLFQFEFHETRSWISCISNLCQIDKFSVVQNDNENRFTNQFAKKLTPIWFFINETCLFKESYYIKVVLLAKSCLAWKILLFNGREPFALILRTAVDDFLWHVCK